MFDKGFLEREKEMLGEHGSLGLTGPEPDESDMIGDAGRIDGENLTTEAQRHREYIFMDRTGIRKIVYRVNRRLSWKVWAAFAAVVAAICWGIWAI